MNNQLQLVPPTGYSLPQVMLPEQHMLPADTTDDELLQLWLAGKSKATIEAYKRDIAYFRLFINNKPFHTVTYADITSYASILEHHYTQAARNRKLASVKSFFSFGEFMGYFTINIPSVLKLKKPENRLAQRILPEEKIVRMIVLTEHPRDHAILRLLYKVGIRVNELCCLKWSDCIPRDIGGQISIYGKGDKTRILLVESNELWQELMALPHISPYVFTSEHANSHTSQHISTNRVYRIVRDAAIRAGIDEPVSPHWMRHAHASHALDHGIHPHVVQTSLGHASLETTTRYSHARPTECSSQGINI